MNTSEQISASKRELGFYRVCYKDRWVVAEWYDNTWWTCGSAYFKSESEIDEIDERRIEIGQLDELSKAGEHWKKRWEIQCEAVDVAQTSVTNLHFELSKAQARIAELESENRDLRKLTDELLKGHE